MKRLKKIFILIGFCLVLSSCSSSLAASTLTNIQPPKTLLPKLTLPEITPAKPKQHTIVIDAGHQQKGNSEREPIGPNASEMKAKVAGGTSGISQKFLNINLLWIFLFC